MSDIGDVYTMKRGWHDSEFFENEEYSRRDAWSWMVGEAMWKDAYKPVNGKKTKLKRGQFSHSLRFMADKWKWSKSRVSRFLEKLAEWDMIETDSGTGQMIITICNYNEYQLKPKYIGTQNGTGAGQERDRSGTKKNTDNTDNNSCAVNAREEKLYITVGKKVWRITEWDQHPTKAYPDYSVIQQWLNSGFDPELDIFPVVEMVCENRGPPSSPNYFTPIIADHHKTRTTKAPEGKHNGKTGTGHKQSLSKSERIAKAIEESNRELGIIP